MHFFFSFTTAEPMDWTEMLTPNPNASPPPTRKLVRKLSGPTPSSKRRASKRTSTEVAPVPRKIPRIDPVNMPPPAVVSNTVVNSEDRYVNCAEKLPF